MVAEGNSMGPNSRETWDVKVQPPKGGGSKFPCVVCALVVQSGVSLSCCVTVVLEDGWETGEVSPGVANRVPNNLPDTKRRKGEKAVEVSRDQILKRTDLC